MIRKKTLCIVDTSSLINSREVKLAQSSLDAWLWKEFEVTYSAAVLDELERGHIGRGSKRNWRDYVWELSMIGSYERLLFDTSRREVEYQCRKCTQIVCKHEEFKVDLGNVMNRGERHNCCIALHAVSKEVHMPVIFLTDDFRAMRDYAIPFFETFPIATIWSLLDFVVWCLTPYRKPGQV
jgi:hypothetical protein